MDEFQIRAFFLVLGMIIGATANNAYNALRYARMAKTEIHQVMLKLEEIEGKITHEGE